MSTSACRLRIEPMEITPGIRRSGVVERVRVKFDGEKLLHVDLHDDGSVALHQVNRESTRAMQGLPPSVV